MPRTASREPTVETRRRARKDGSHSEEPTVRYYDEQGVRRRQACETPEEADFERARLALEQSRSGPIAAPVQCRTLEELWPEYKEDATLRLEGNTLDDYEGHWKRQLVKRFGDWYLDEITPREVSRWRSQMQNAGVGQESIRKAMVLLQAMFTLAIEWGEVTANPVSVVRKPRQGRQQAIEVVDPKIVELVRRWFIARGDHFSATLVSVLAYSGLRPGEALALQRRHVRTATMLIEQAVAQGRLKLQKTGRVYRTVDLLDPLSEDLAGWFQIAGLDRPKAGLFLGSDGEWFSKDDWDNWRNRRFYAALDDLGLDRFRPYDLRHSFASLLIREGETSIVELAEQLGHSPTETLKTYGHVFSEYRRQPRVPAIQLIAAARAGGREASQLAA
jgi:integrase